MNWHSWQEFLYMGGYALYVWGSFAVTAILVAGEIVMLRLHRKKALELALNTVKYGKVKNDENEA